MGFLGGGDFQPKTPLGSIFPMDLPASEDEDLRGETQFHVLTLSILKCKAFS